jgi:hypothetical protein
MFARSTTTPMDWATSSGSSGLVSSFFTPSLTIVNTLPLMDMFGNAAARTTSLLMLGLTAALCRYAGSAESSLNGTMFMGVSLSVLG